MKRSHLELALEKQIASTQLPAPVAEHRFAKEVGRQWRFDLAWPELLVACEIDGAIWSRGRHARGSGIQNDCHKYCTAAMLGWRVLRVSSDMVYDGSALSYIMRTLNGKDYL